MECPHFTLPGQCGQSYEMVGCLDGWMGWDVREIIKPVDPQHNHQPVESKANNKTAAEAKGDELVGLSCWLIGFLGRDVRREVLSSIIGTISTLFVFVNFY